MPFVTNLTTYTIDLDLPEEDRWDEVIKKEKRAARALIGEAQSVFDSMPLIVRKIVGKAFDLFYRSAGVYTGEIQAWADSLDIDFGELALLQCAYELEHFSRTGIMGCTTGCFWHKRYGMVHMRTLDWQMSNIGRATRLFKFQTEDHMFLSVSMPGLVGALSGMVPGEYSATINWAPPSGRPHLSKMAVMFLLRNTLEECSTYCEAVYMLKNSPVSASVIYTVCGVEPNEACVIERTQIGASVRKMKGANIVAGNHFESSRFGGYNDACADDELMSDSEERCGNLHEALEEIPIGANLSQIGTRLRAVESDHTKQRMVFAPSSGEYKVWARD